MNENLEISAERMGCCVRQGACVTKDNGLSKVLQCASVQSSTAAVHLIAIAAKLALSTFQEQGYVDYNNKQSHPVPNPDHGLAPA